MSYVKIIATVDPQVLAEAIESAPPGMATSTAIVRYAIARLAGIDERTAAADAVRRPCVTAHLKASEARELGAS